MRLADIAACTHRDQRRTIAGHRGGASTVIYVGVPHLRAAYDKALASGAEAAIPPRPLPGKGSFAVVLDPDKNRLGLFSSDATP